MVTGDDGYAEGRGEPLVDVEGPDVGSGHEDCVDDTHDGRSVELAVVTVVPDPDGVTLADLVDAVRGLVGDQAALDGRLTHLGWSAQDRSDVEPLVVADVARIAVHVDTPRLVPGSLISGQLPSGIGALSYDIRLDELFLRRVPAGLADAARSVAP